MNRHRRLGLPGVIHIHTDKDPRPVKTKLRRCSFCIRESQVEGSKCAVRNMDAPLIRTPVDYAGRILSIQGRSSSEMRVVESYIVRRSVASSSFNVDIARAV